MRQGLQWAESVVVSSLDNIVAFVGEGLDLGLDEQDKAKEHLLRLMITNYTPDSDSKDPPIAWAKVNPPS
jgi:hypothetical protein